MRRFAETIYFEVPVDDMDECYVQNGPLILKRAEKKGYFIIDYDKN